MRAALAVAVLAACSTPREPKYGVLVPHDVPAKPATDVFRDLLAADGSCKAAPPATISRADALADLDTVERVLRRGYAGLEVQAMRGVSWDRVFREMRDALDGMKEPIATDMFGSWLADRLTITQDDTITVTAYDKAGTPRTETAGAHDDAYALDLVTDEQDRILSAADPKLVGKVVRDCDRTREARTATGTSGVLGGRYIVLAPRAPAPVTCTLEDVDSDKETTATVAFHRLAPGGTAPGAVFEQRGTVPILRVRSLDEDNHPQELSQLTNAAFGMMQQPAFVVDLRGVAPGNYSFTWFFRALMPTTPSASELSVDSEVTAQGAFNRALCAPTDDTKLDDERASVDALAKTGHAERAWLRGRMSAMPSVGGRAPTRPYAGVMVMVVDSHCAGDCEAAVNLLRLLPRTLLVGENTAGRGEIAEPLPYRLPRSGLWLTAGRTLHADLTEQGRGIHPDVWLDGDKTDEAIDAIARCAADAGCARDLVKPRY